MSSLPPASSVWAYLRHSPGEDQSIDSQLDAVTQYCQRHNLALTQIYTDESKSGSERAGRTDFNRMIFTALQEPRPADALIIWSFSRFARDFDGAQAYLGQLRLAGWHIVSMTDQIPAGKVGRLVEAIIHFQNDEFLERMSKDVKRGQQWLAKQGYVPGGFPPRGYKVVKEKIGTKKNGDPRYGRRWIPDPDTAHLARKAWQMRAAGASHQEIHRATGLYKSKSCWPSFFQNTAYIGQVTYGHEVDETGQPVIDSETGEPVPIIVEIEPLIDEATFTKVQKLMSEHTRHGQSGTDHHPRRANSTYILSGLLECAICGAGYIGGRSRNHYFYVCGAKKRYKACASSRISAKRLESAIIAHLRDELLAPGRADELARVANESHTTSQTTSQADIDTTQQRITQTNRAIRNLVQAIEDGLDDISDIAQRIRELKSERDALQAQHAELIAAQEPIAPLTATDIRAALEDLQHHLDQADPQTTKNALNQIVERIIINTAGTQTECRIYYRIPGQSDLYKMPPREIVI